MSRPTADSHKRLSFRVICPLVQHGFGVFFHILGLWANDFKILTKIKLSECHIMELFLT